VTPRSTVFDFMHLFFFPASTSVTCLERPPQRFRRQPFPVSLPSPADKVRMPFLALPLYLGCPYVTCVIIVLVYLPPVPVSILSRFCLPPFRTYLAILVFPLPVIPFLFMLCSDPRFCSRTSQRLAPVFRPHPIFRFALSRSGPFVRRQPFSFGVPARTFDPLPGRFPTALSAIRPGPLV